MFARAVWIVLIYSVNVFCQSLRQQLKSTQEDFFKRETRWTSTHQRLRQQLDTVSAENTALRDQVRMLEKLRLTTWKNAETEREKEKERSITAQKRAKSKVQKTTT